MTDNLHLIYIPGLGDARLDGQSRAVKAWRWWAVESSQFEIGWTDNEPWPEKLERLLDMIDGLTEAGKKVALVGASAGASAAIIAYAERKSVITGVVCIAGKVNHPETVNPVRYRTNPAFEQAIQDCQPALQNLTAADRQRIQSRYALFDEIVTRSDSYIPGAHNRRVFSVEHGFTIATQITLGAPGFIRFLKRLPASA